MITKKSIINLKKCFLISAICSIYFLLQIRYIENMVAPNILADEFGYIANAAYFSGLEWSDCIQKAITYYSFGYSILLIPFIKIYEYGDDVYKAAVLLNALLASIAIPFYYAILRRIIDKDSVDNKIDLRMLTISLVTVMNFGYVYYKSYALPVFCNPKV